jgi:hypothetical protein
MCHPAPGALVFKAMVIDSLRPTSCCWPTASELNNLGMRPLRRLLLLWFGGLAALNVAIQCILRIRISILLKILLLYLISCIIINRILLLEDQSLTHSLVLHCKTANLLLSLLFPSFPFFYPWRNFSDIRRWLGCWWGVERSRGREVPKGWTWASILLIEDRLILSLQRCEWHLSLLASLQSLTGQVTGSLLYLDPG